MAPYEGRCSFPADVSARLIDLPIMRAWLDPRVEVASANDMASRYAEWRNVLDLADVAVDLHFPSREAATSTLFDYASGAGFGIPTVLREAFLELLEQLPPEAASQDLVRLLLMELGRSRASRDRLALASTISQGESAWVGEVAFHAERKGLSNDREVSRGGVTRIDLFLEGTAVEFKAYNSMWAVKELDDDARALLWNPDIAKLSRATVAGMMVISTVTLTDEVAHRRPRYRASRSATPGAGDLRAEEIQNRGLDAIRRFLEPVCASATVVDLGAGRVPGSGGEVLLGAVIGVVRA